MINNTRFLTLFKTLSLFLLIFSGLLLVSNFKQSEAETNDDTKTDQKSFSPTEDHAQTTKALVRMLRNSHYLDEIIDNAFSEKVFNNYIKLLDPGKVHFLATDIEAFSTYRHSFDENLKQGKLEPAFFIYSRFYQ